MLRLLFRFVLIVGLLMISCISSRPQTSYEYELGERIITNPILIKIDKRFNDRQKESIDRALSVWEEQSDHKIKFVVEWNQTSPTTNFGDYELKKNSGVFFWSIPRSPPQVTAKQNKDWATYIGITIFGPGDNSADIIIFDECIESNFYGVALHEIGHLIGLNHVPNKYSVMSPHVSSYCITEYDAYQLCDLYGCHPHPECLSDTAAKAGWASRP